MGTLDGRAALVTGSAQGIGRGIAHALAKEGASVAVVDLNAEGAAQVAKEITGFGGHAIGIRCDVRESAQVEAAVEQTVAAFGGLNILVNNAMAARLGVPFEETTDDDLMLAFRSGPLAAFYFMRAAFPHLRDRDGRIINIRSGSEVQGLVGFASYVGAKAAVGGLTRAGAREWGRKGITVNAIAPFSLSPMAQAHFEANPDELDAALSSLSIPRSGDPETEIGRAAVYLAGPDASFITGCTISVSGGGSFFG
jgi:NAD(P)-dependent dehydrogenase (short-subunit alcohol dehydrogenase family)